MAAQSPKRRGAASPQAREYITTSIRLRVSTAARVAAAAQIAGVDKSRFMADAVEAALAGIVLVDRRKSVGRASSSDEGIGGETAA